MAGGLIAPEEPGRMVVWFSCGAASAVAAKLVEPDVIIDEIPIDQPVTQALSPECDFLCSLAEQQMVQEGDAAPALIHKICA